MNGYLGLIELILVVVLVFGFAGYELVKLQRDTRKASQGVDSPRVQPPRAAALGESGDPQA